MRYLRVIMNYSLSTARASLPFSELTRIKIPKPTAEEIELLNNLDNKLQKKLMETNELQKKVESATESFIGIGDENPYHKEDFDNLLMKASRGFGTDAQT